MRQDVAASRCRLMDIAADVTHLENDTSPLGLWARTDYSSWPEEGQFQEAEAAAEAETDRDWKDAGEWRRCPRPDEPADEAAATEQLNEFWSQFRDVDHQLVAMLTREKIGEYAAGSLLRRLEECRTALHASVRPIRWTSLESVEMAQIRNAFRGPCWLVATAASHLIVATEELERTECRLPDKTQTGGSQRAKTGQSERKPSNQFWESASKEQKAMMRHLLRNSGPVLARSFESEPDAFRAPPSKRRDVTSWT